MEIISKIIELLIYIAIGVIFCIIGYKVIQGIYRKSFNINEEIDNHNKAIGIMLSGMFIGIAIIMSGVL